MDIISEIKIPTRDVFELVEHGHFSEEEADYVSSLSIPFRETEYEKEPVYLGIVNNSASYYIGAAWLTPDGTVNSDTKAVTVVPKIDVDFVEMLVSALSFASSAEYFVKFYGIDFDAPRINTYHTQNQLTPLLIVHFLSIMKVLVKHGLKRGYVWREENLNKIKGRLSLTKHLQKNVFSRREDRNYCRYQDYTEDILENRLLKKTILFVECILNNTAALKSHPKLSALQSEINGLKTAFSNVSSEVEIQQVGKCYANKVFREYSEAIKLARMILRRFDYSIKTASEEQYSTPPFWIDMSRLYEVYVYSKLADTYGIENIGFQISGHGGTAVDFIKIDEHLILDTKYKPRYEIGNRGMMDDIREISGYARDSKILGKIGESMDSNDEVKCVIIYPVLQPDLTDNESEQNNGSNERNYSSFPKGQILPLCTKIRSFRNFYKISVPLPKL